MSIDIKGNAANTRVFSSSFLNLYIDYGIFVIWIFSLLYANVSVGTPSISYLVALDTGSDLFWLPCDCISCVRGLKTSDGEVSCFLSTIDCKFRK